MSSNTINITVSIISHREPPKNTTALLQEDVPITTQLQLAKNLRHWREQFMAVVWVTKQLYKPKYSLTQKSEKVKEALSLTSKIRVEEHYWVIIRFSSHLTNSQIQNFFQKKQQLYFTREPQRMKTHNKL